MYVSAGTPRNFIHMYMGVVDFVQVSEEHLQGKVETWQRVPFTDNSSKPTLSVLFCWRIFGLSKTVSLSLPLSLSLPPSFSPNLQWSTIFPNEQVTQQQSALFVKKLLAVAVSAVLPVLPAHCSPVPCSSSASLHCTISFSLPFPSLH